MRRSEREREKILENLSWKNYSSPSSILFFLQQKFRYRIRVLKKNKKKGKKEKSIDTIFYFHHIQEFLCILYVFHISTRWLVDLRSISMFRERNKFTVLFKANNSIDFEARTR